MSDIIKKIRDTPLSVFFAQAGPIKTVRGRYWHETLDPKLPRIWAENFGIRIGEFAK